LALFLLLVALVVLTPILYCHSSCNCSIFTETCRLRPAVTEAPSMETCLQYPATPRCPRLVGVEGLPFAQYDYRIDVKPAKYTMHAAVEVCMPDLDEVAPDVANDFTKLCTEYPVLEHIPLDASLLVYCTSPYGAFYAGKVLLKVGYTDVSSFYFGGWNYINTTVTQQNRDSVERPTKDYCYVNGPSDDCPTVISVKKLKSRDEITSIVNSTSYNLVDIRPSEMFNMGSIVGALSMAGGHNDTTAFNAITNRKTEIWVTFCMRGVMSYMGARNMKRVGFERVYFLDNGGYPELKDIEGFTSTVE